MRFLIQSPAGVEVEVPRIDAVRSILADEKPLTIMSKHAPLMAALGQQPIITVQSGVEQSYTVRNGILLVADNTVRVLTAAMLLEGSRDA
jgi:F0F1-type ATP synthase epsilon subunit